MTTLFAALNIANGSVISMCRHRHTERLKFLRPIDRKSAKNLTLHLIVDNYATQPSRGAGLTGLAPAVRHALTPRLALRG